MPWKESSRVSERLRFVQACLDRRVKIVEICQQFGIIELGAGRGATSGLSSRLKSLLLGHDSQLVSERGLPFARPSFTKMAL